MGKSNTRSDSKSDRKFEKKLEFYSKVKDSVTSLSAQKSIAKKKNKQQRRQQKKLKAYNFSSLLESLPEVTAPRKPSGEGEFKLTSKSRKKLVIKEGKRLSAFLKDPSFQADPLAAIYQHLQSTQPVVVEEKPKKKANQNGSKKKKKKSKTETGMQSMEM